MQSKASTVAQYLAELPADRRAAIAAVRDVMRRNLDKQCAEGMSYGMIGWHVPHSVYPPGYHCDPRQPLPVAGLASQKNAMSLYLMGLYCGCDGAESDHLRWFREAWAKTGKKLDMGKACIRFKRLEDLPLDLIAEALRRMSLKAYIEHYEQLRASTAKGARPGPSAKKVSTKAPAQASAGTGKPKPRATASKKAASRGGRAKVARR